MPRGRPPKLYEETQEGKRQAKRLEKEQARKEKLALKAAEKEEKGRERLRKAEQKKAEKEEKRREEKRRNIGRNCGAKGLSLLLRCMTVPDELNIYIYLYIFFNVKFVHT